MTGYSRAKESPAHDSNSSGSSGSTEPVLSIDGVSKSFGSVTVLEDANLTCYPGEFHALIGENGAGKSTLIKIASGLLRPDSGSVTIGGVELRRPSASTARSLGLLTAYQDTSLVPDLTAAENLVLSFHGFERLSRLLPWTSLDELFDRYDLPFGPHERVAELSPASRQLLEVVRTLIHRPKVLLLDEPTAALDLESSHRLEELLKQALAEGTGILYVSHRLDEVKRMAHRLTILRDGQMQGSFTGDELSVDEIVSLMVGVPTELEFPPKPVVPSTASRVLEVRDLYSDRFGPISLEAREGEVVGIAGAEGNGQRELLRALAGLSGAEGHIAIGGKQIKPSDPGTVRDAGLVFMSGDRAAETVFRRHSVMANTVAGSGQKLGPAGLVFRSHELEIFEAMAERLSIVHASPDQPAAELSGGNQQKTVVGRILLTNSDIWIVDDPTQGVDARARMDIYRVLRSQVAEGTTVILNSSDSAELAGLCDRVYVLSRGIVVAELQGDHVEEAEIVESFVAPTDSGNPPVAANSGAPQAVLEAVKRRPWRGISVPPLAVVFGLLLLVGAYTATQSDVFLTDSNLNAWFVPAVPLVILVMGLQTSLLSGEFDISVGSVMSLSVVLASFWATSENFVDTIPGLLGCLAAGVGVGLVNAFVVRGLRVGAIIGTIGTLGVFSGLAILLRPAPGGAISYGLTEALSSQVGFVPIALIVVAALALLADFWRVKTPSGLSMRAIGLSEEATRRTGLPISATKVASYVASGLLAVIAGIFLSTQLGLGQNNVGAGYPLLGFAACFLGGAALTGGRGTYTGAVIGALFLTLLVNVTPLLEIESAWSLIMTGVLTIVAVAAYSVDRRSPRPRLGRRARADSAAPGEAIEGGSAK
jgi:ribose transport system ATP-binding protein